MDRLLRLGGAGMGMGQNAQPTDAPVVDTAEQVYISSLALLKMLKHGRAGRLNINCIEFLNKLLPIIIIMVACYSLFGSLSTTQGDDLPKITPILKLKQWLQGLALGFFDGVAGPGAGTFWTASNSLFYKMSFVCFVLSTTVNKEFPGDSVY